VTKTLCLGNAPEAIAIDGCYSLEVNRDLLYSNVIVAFC
jgi:hypothetical protein